MGIELKTVPICPICKKLNMNEEEKMNRVICIEGASENLRMRNRLFSSQAIKNYLEKRYLRIKMFEGLSSDNLRTQNILHQAYIAEHYPIPDFHYGVDNKTTPIDPKMDYPLGLMRKLYPLFSYTEPNSRTKISQCEINTSKAEKVIAEKIKLRKF